ncbi:MAG: hypothetical protein K8Q97_04790 [Candidatus Andersenbacteria bacterium]|nr:hypothetical protein [Candidatus Andersenbacteria bacterium]
MAKYLYGPFTQYLRLAIIHQCGENPNQRLENITVFCTAYKLLKQFDESGMDDFNLKTNLRQETNYLAEVAAERLQRPITYLSACVIVECLIKRLATLIGDPKTSTWISTCGTKPENCALQEVLKNMQET